MVVRVVVVEEVEREVIKVLVVVEVEKEKLKNAYLTTSNNSLQPLQPITTSTTTN